MLLDFYLLYDEKGLIGVVLPDMVDKMMYQHA